MSWWAWLLLGITIGVPLGIGGFMAFLAAEDMRMRGNKAANYQRD